MKAKIALLGVGLLMIATSVAGDDRDNRFRVATSLKPSAEIPSVSSKARGFFKASVDADNQIITFELTYSGIAQPTQAHIHFGQVFAANGGVSVFLCSNTGTPAGAQPCPASDLVEAKVIGTLGPANVIGPSSQGIAPSEFDELVAAIRRGLTYINVHSATFTGGEIRGQLDPPDRR